MSVAAGLLLAGTAAAGCGARAPELAGPPPIPVVDGPIEVDVVYPPDGSRIAVRDSNFIFGSVGTGRAELRINGEPVPVEPNGAFLAWLPVPVVDDSTALYELVADLDGRRERVTHRVRLPARIPEVPEAGARAGSARGRLEVDTTSLEPRGLWWVRPGEAVQVELRATSGARARLLLPDGDTIPLREAPPTGAASDGRWAFGRGPLGVRRAPTGTGRYRGSFPARIPLGRGSRGPRPPVRIADPAFASPACALRRPPDARGGWPRPVTVAEASGPAHDTLSADGVDGGGGPPLEAGAEIASAPGADVECAVIELARDGQVIRLPLPLDLWVMEGSGHVIEVREAPSFVGRDGVTIGRPAPGATYAWLWADGVRAPVTGRRDGQVRVRLDATTEAWVASDDVDWLPPGARVDRARVGTVRLRGTADRVIARIAVSEPVPYAVRIDGRRASLVLYRSYSDTDWLRYGRADPFLQAADWFQPASDRYTLHLDFARPPWGYDVRYESGALVLEVRKPPEIDPDRPLSGRTIAIDPGHPPAGATGPTRLYEGDANLAIAYRVRRRLEREGARALLVRTDRGPVRLYDRVDRAQLFGAEVLVSIHNNALPDGVRPFEAHGTSVYYFQPFSRDLARSLQRELLAAMGLDDLGIGRANLALARPTWMPAALTEGAFMMIPEQEAALRRPAFQEAYARGVVEGLRRFLRERGR